MNYRVEKLRNNKKQLIHTLQNHFNTLKKDNCFFGYTFKTAFLLDKLIILLTQDKTGLALQIHVVIEDNGRNVVEHFTLYEDSTVATFSPHLNEVALTSLILRGLNVLFFLATCQQLSGLSFYLWHEEAEHLLPVKIFFKEMSSIGNYVNFKMPTKTTDYDSFINVAHIIFKRFHDRLWRLQKSNKHVRLFLQTKELLRKFPQTSYDEGSSSLSHP